MPVRIKQDRSRKSGHIHSRNAQDAPVVMPDIVQQAVLQATGRKPKRTKIIVRAVDPVELLLLNVRNSRNLLQSMLQRYGDRLPPTLRSQVAVIVANMESVL